MPAFPESFVPMSGETGDPVANRKKRLIDRVIEQLGQPGKPFSTGGSTAGVNLNPNPPTDATPQVTAQPDRMDELLKQLSTPTPRAPIETPPSQADVMQRQYEQTYVHPPPPTGRQTLMQAVSQLAPVAIGGLVGGLPGAAGAAGGVEQHNLTQEALKEQRRRELVQGIESQRTREERLNAAVIGANQRAQAAEEATRRAELGGLIRGEYQTQVQGLKGEVQKAQLSQKESSDLFKQGRVRDPVTGEIRVMTPEEMPQQMRDVHDLTQAKKDAQEARAQLDKMKADPNSPIYQAQLNRVNMTAQALALRQNMFNARYLGIDPSGKPLTGALLTPEGQVVPPVNAPNVRPTGQAQTKATMGESAKEQMIDIKAIVRRHPEVFGPGHGQVSDVEKWFGTQSPDAQAFLTARTIVADHLAATFAGRSDQATTKLMDAVGRFKDNPKAMDAGLDQLMKAADLFIQRGSKPTVGGNVSTGGIPTTGGDMIWVQIPGQKPGQIHRSQLRAFQAKYPGAAEVQPPK